MEIVNEFVRELPSHNEENFSLFFTEYGIRASSKQPSIYLPTEDLPSEQIIIAEKKNILLRFAHQQWLKKSSSKKRDPNEDLINRKRIRLDTN